MWDLWRESFVADNIVDAKLDFIGAKLDFIWIMGRYESAGRKFLN